jgi:hypothetical protein
MSGPVGDRVADIEIGYRLDHKPRRSRRTAFVGDASRGPIRFRDWFPFLSARVAGAP